MKLRGPIKTGLSVFSKILVFILITSAVSEIGLRLYHQINPSFVFSDSTYNRYRGKPHSMYYDFRLNSKGFRDVEFEEKKKEGIYRILGIGDSFVFGVVPYKYNFLTLLENKLNEDGKFEVINMGIPSTSYESYFALLVGEGIPLNPDMVICFVFIGNDLTEKNKDEALQGKLYVWSLLRFLYYMLTGFEGIQIYGEGEEYDDDAPTFEPERFMRIEISRSKIYLKNNVDIRSLVDRAGDYLKMMKDACASRKIEFLVVLIPDEVQVDESLMHAVITNTKAGRDDFDFELPNRLIRARLFEVGIRYIDLYDDFKNLAMQYRLYKPYDTHWNIDGNRAASGLLYERLKALIPNFKTGG